MITGLTQPTSLAFGRDGQVYVAGNSELMKRVGGLEDSTPDVFADLRPKVHDYWDRGLLSIALHPDFPTRDVVYALYTYDAPIGGVAPAYADACDDPEGAGCVVSGRLLKLTNIAATGHA